MEARVPKPVDARTELEGRRGFESWSQLGFFALKSLLNATLFPFIDGLSRELNDTQREYHSYNVRDYSDVTVGLYFVWQTGVNRYS